MGLELFFHKVTNFVVDLMKEAYPELESQGEFINKMVRLEEERFGSTLTVGLQKLEELFAKSGSGLPSYADLARLYDTFGTPRDLIRVSLDEQGHQISEEVFLAEFDSALKQLQQTGARDQSAAKERANSVYGEVAQTTGVNSFTGYDGTNLESARVLSIIENGHSTESIEGGQRG